MSDAMYSLWLMPDAASLALFRSINRALGAQFGAPSFEPHLTLIGGRMLDADRLRSTLPGVTSGLSAFSTPIINVVTGPKFFQSFYALFAAEGPVLELKKRSMRMLDEDTGAFMPHLSLLYGEAEPKAKEAARQRLAQDLKGQQVRFDSITVAFSSDTVPVAEWRIVHTIRLN